MPVRNYSAQKDEITFLPETTHLGLFESRPVSQLTVHDFRNRERVEAAA